MNIYVYALLLSVSALRLSAQSVSGGGRLQMTKSDTIAYEFFDTAKYRVFYRTLIAPDSANAKSTLETRTLLLIGKKHQGFLDYNNHQKDSLYNARLKEGNSVGAMGELLSYGRLACFSPYIIKDYPQRGATLFQEAPMVRQNLRYADEYPNFGWELQGGARVVQGIECKRATCRYRGRDYEAWYAPSIPISSGPYVFGGLPGLILQIEDSRGHYSFTLAGFHEVQAYDPIYLPSKNVVETTRKEVDRTKRSIAENPGLMLKGLSGRVQFPSGLPKVKPRPYNPIELE